MSIMGHVRTSQPVIIKRITITNIEEERPGIKYPENGTNITDMVIERIRRMGF